MMVMPFTSARTSRGRFTLLKVFSAVLILSFEIPQPAAKAAAAVAFKTLYSPPERIQNRPNARHYAALTNWSARAQVAGSSYARWNFVLRRTAPLHKTRARCSAGPPLPDRRLRSVPVAAPGLPVA